MDLHVKAHMKTQLGFGLFWAQAQAQAIDFEVQVEFGLVWLNLRPQIMYRNHM